MGASNNEKTPTFTASAGTEGLSVENFLTLVQIFIQQHGACDQPVVRARRRTRDLLAFAARSHGIDTGAEENPRLPGGVQLDCKVLTMDGRRLARITVHDGVPKEFSPRQAVAQIWTGSDGCQHGSYRTGEGTACWGEVLLEDSGRGTSPA
ncbi:hypothetical protein [Actinomadura coerulea]|uniref:hypothetical protein n=1 Tax=Actinomadura coerulea TaxID=46159 RepID=UPI00343F131E